MPSSLAVSQDVLLQPVQLGHRVAVVQQAQELALGMLVAGGAVAADADAQDARAAALALGLQHGVQDDLAAAVQVAVGLELLDGQRVLGAHVLAAAALEHQPHLDLRRAVLVEMEAWARPGPRLVPSFAPVSESTEFWRR